jgi:hypothetical protein
MTNEQNTNPGGRPAIGPAISVAYPQNLLDEVDVAANRQRTSRAHWLRAAAAASLPYDALTGNTQVQHGLRELDGWLASERDAALDAELPREEREFRGEAYASALHEMHVVLQKARDALPIEGSRDAYERAEEAEPDTSTDLAQMWARTVAVNKVDALLEGLLMMLPVGGWSVRDRASLEDPNMNLD